MTKLDNGGSVEIQFVANKLDSVPDEEKIIEEAATKDKMEIGMNLNLAVLKQITSVKGDAVIAEQPVKLTELKDTIMMNIPIPEEMQNQKRYVVYRYHDGKVDRITKGDTEEHIVVDKDDMNITLYAKKFSTYTLAYEKDNSEVEKAVADVSKLVEAIGAVDAGTASKEKIEAARKAYEALSEEAKKAVPAETLKALKNAEAAFAKATEEKKKAEDAVKLIKAIGTVDAKNASKEKIEAARKAYDALSAEAKKAVPAETLKALTDAETAYKKAVAANEVKDESALSGNDLSNRSDLPLLLTTGKETGKTSVKLSWLKVDKATGYEVYWSYCNGKKNFKKLAAVKASKSRNYTHKKIKKNKSYKYFIAAYKVVDGKKVYLAKSPEIHVAMSYNSKTNAKSIKVNKTKISLAANKTFKLKASIVKQDKKKKVLTHAAELRYYSSDLTVAVVDKKGNITAKGKGSCTIYVIANNGVSKKVKVTVK